MQWRLKGSFSSSACFIARKGKTIIGKAEVLVMYIKLFCLKILYIKAIDC